MPLAPPSSEGPSSPKNKDILLFLGNQLVVPISLIFKVRIGFQHLPLLGTENILTPGGFLLQGPKSQGCHTPPPSALGSRLPHTAPLESGSSRHSRTAESAASRPWPDARVLAPTAFLPPSRRPGPETSALGTTSPLLVMDRCLASSPIPSPSPRGSPWGSDPFTHRRGCASPRGQERGRGLPEAIAGPEGSGGRRAHLASGVDLESFRKQGCRDKRT